MLNQIYKYTKFDINTNNFIFYAEYSKYLKNEDKKITDKKAMYSRKITKGNYQF